MCSFGGLIESAQFSRVYMLSGRDNEVLEENFVFHP